MAEQFDPYHVWLGIPPHEQPPNIYRLLGIPPFSSDPDVIESAADRQMAHLRTFQIGSHSDLSQKLLNEVAAARICLFNVQKRAAYDQQLRQEMMPTIVPSTVSAPPVQEPSPASSPELHREFDHFSAIVVSSGASSARKRVRKRKRASTKHTVVSIAGIIVFGLIGLSAGCFVLFLINPQHPLIESMVSFVHDTDVTKQSSTAPPRPSSPQQQENRRRSLQPSRQPDKVSAPPSPKIEPISLEPDQSRKTGDPQPPQEPRGNRDTSKVTAGPSPVETRQNIVLDLSRRVLRTKLPENVSRENTVVRVERVTGLGTPYEFQPSHGIITHKQPVDIVLMDYPDVNIHLTLQSRNGATLDVAPQIDTGQGKKVEFTQQRVKQLCANVTRDIRKLSWQLSAAQTEAQSIKSWLASPVRKPLQLRGMKKQQLIILENQTIPALQTQASYMQARVVLLQRLSQFVKQIHEKVSITVVTTSSPEP